MREVFISKFQGTYARPGNPWDLKNCRQKAGETLRECIRCFSQQYDNLPNMVDADVVDAFLSGTTFEPLVHELGSRCPRTARELLDIATSHASSEEAVGALLQHAPEDKGNDKRNEGASEGTPSRPSKKHNKA